MTRKEIWGDSFKKTVVPVLLALILFYAFKTIFTKDGVTNYFYVWICCGIPFGIRRMFVWLVPHGYDTGGTFGIIALNFIRHRRYLRDHCLKLHCRRSDRRRHSCMAACRRCMVCTADGLSAVQLSGKYIVKYNKSR